MRARFFTILAATSVFGAIAPAACTYDPQPVDGKLRCSTSGECPDGYSCTTCGTCWSNRRSGDTSGSLWGTSAPLSTLNHYVGTWAFGSCANLDTQCDDGYTDSSPLNTDATDPPIMFVSAGASGTADLVSDWLCLLDLRLASEGAHLYGSGQGCTIPNPDVAGLVQTWTATRFDIVTNDGTTAVHSAAYTRLDEYSDGSVTTCTQQVQAPMTKM